jgi:AraC family cel operon transcriptional repressor
MSLFRWRDYSPHGEACHISRADQVAASGVERHHHDYYEIFRVASGSGWHWCAEREHPLRAGHLVFVRPRDKHGFRTEISSEPFVFVNVAFSAASWAHLSQRYGWRQRAFFNEEAAEPPVLALDPATDRAAAALFAEMLSAPRTQATLDWFLLSVARLTETPAGLDSPIAAPPWLHHALVQFSRYDAALNQGPAQLARMAGCSEAHLSRSFRAHLGQTPTQWILRLRLRRAASLLEATTYAISEVASMAGFENLSNFHRRFRAETGITPLAYRQQKRRSVV